MRFRPAWERGKKKEGWGHLQDFSWKMYALNNCKVYCFYFPSVLNWRLKGQSSLQVGEYWWGMRLKGSLRSNWFVVLRRDFAMYIPDFSNPWFSFFSLECCQVIMLGSCPNWLEKSILLSVLRVPSNPHTLNKSIQCARGGTFHKALDVLACTLKLASWEVDFSRRAVLLLECTVCQSSHAQ